MASSLNQVIRERKKALLNIYQRLKMVDNRLEISERYLKRIRSRKKMVPEDRDLQYLADEVNVVIKLIDDYVRVLGVGFEIKT